MMYRRHPGDARVSASPFAAMIWRAAASAGVHFRWDGDCYQTHGLSRDAWPTDAHRWEADSALSSLSRAVREHPKLAGDPLLRYMLLYVTLDYVTDLWEHRR